MKRLELRFSPFLLSISGSMVMALGSACGGSNALQNPLSTPSELMAELRESAGAGSRDASALVAALREGDDPTVIADALERLGYIGSDEHVDAIAELTKDTRWGVSHQALTALGRIGTERAVAVLIELTDDPHIAGSAVAPLAMASHPSALEALIGWAEESSDDATFSAYDPRDLRGAAIRTLGQTRNPRALPVLRTLAEERSGAISHAAIEAISALRTDEGEAYLRSVVESEDRSLSERATAMQGLRNNSREVLEAYAQSEVSALADPALRVLAMTNREQHMSFLTDYVMDESRPYQQRVGVLHQLGVDAIPVLRQLVEQREYNLVQQTIGSVIGVGNPEAQQFAHDLAFTEGRPLQLRLAAARSLRHLDSPEEWRTLLNMADRSQPYYYYGYGYGGFESLNLDRDSIAHGIELAKTSNHRTQVRIIRALGTLRAPAVDELLSSEARSDEPQNYRWAISALAQRGTEESTRTLLGLSQDDSVGERRAHALRQLSGNRWGVPSNCCREEIAGILRQAAESEVDQSLRHHILNYLVYQGDRASVDLAHQIEEEGEVVKAIEFYGLVLQQQGNSQLARAARSHLFRLAESESDPSTQQLATNKLFYIPWGTSFPWDDRILTFLVERSEEITPEMGYGQLLPSLPLTHGDIVVPFLTRLAEGDQQQAATSAVTALIQRSEPEAVAVLERIAADPTHPGSTQAFRWLAVHDSETALTHALEFLENDPHSTTQTLVELLDDPGVEKVFEWLDQKQAEEEAEQQAAAAAAAAQGGTAPANPIPVAPTYGPYGYGDPRDRAISALCNFVEFGDDPWILGRPEFLRRILSSPAETVRRSALQTLSWRGPGAVLSVYEDALRDPSESVRMTVIQYIQFPDARSRDEVLSNALDDENEEVRDAALRRIGLEPAVGEELREKVLEALEAQPGRVASMLYGYQGIGRTWVDEYLDSEAPAASRIEVLEAIGYGLTPTRLRSLWENPAPEFRAFAVRHAWRWRSANVEDFLLEAVRDDEAPVRLAAVEQLGNQRSAAALRAVRRAMSDDDSAVRSAALLAAARMDPRMLQDVIARMTNRRLPQRERLEAARAIRTLGPMVTLTPAQQRTFDKLIARDTTPVGPGALSPAP